MNPQDIFQQMQQSRFLQMQQKQASLAQSSGIQRSQSATNQMLPSLSVPSHSVLPQSDQNSGINQWILPQNNMIDNMGQFNSHQFTGFQDLSFPSSIQSFQQPLQSPSLPSPSLQNQSFPRPVNPSQKINFNQNMNVPPQNSQQNILNSIQLALKQKLSDQDLSWQSTSYPQLSNMQNMMTNFPFPNVQFPNNSFNQMNSGINPSNQKNSLNSVMDPLNQLSSPNNPLNQMNNMPIFNDMNVPLGTLNQMNMMNAPYNKMNYPALPISNYQYTPRHNNPSQDSPKMLFNSSPSNSSMTSPKHLDMNSMDNNPDLSRHTTSQYTIKLNNSWMSDIGKSTDIKTIETAREFYFKESLRVHNARTRFIIQEYHQLLSKRNASNYLPGRYPYPDICYKSNKFRCSESIIRFTETLKECLAPIRLDFEHEGFKIREVFLWNINDSTISKELFSELLCVDLNCADDTKLILAPLISKSIKEQIENFIVFGGAQLFTTSQGQGKELHDSKSKIISSRRLDNQPLQRDLRVVIKLDITIGTIYLTDQFEWDMESKDNDPEHFAHILVSDLNLPRDFESAISHQIRDQLYNYSKSLLLLDNSKNSNNIEQPPPSFILPRLESLSRIKVEEKNGFFPVLRNECQDKILFGPQITNFDPDEFEKIDRDRDRDARRKRRQSQRSRKAIANIPDKDTLKTVLTCMTTSLTLLESKPIKEFGREGLYKYDLCGRLVKDTFNQTTEILQEVPMKKGHLEWRCQNCNVTADQTTFIRRGPNKERVMCNLCGIYYSKFNTMRPSNDPGKYDTLSADSTTNDPPLPSWIMQSLDKIQSIHENDSFDIVWKKIEWKIICHDCIGKMYSVGTNKHLEGFEIHVKNKSHRNNVATRLKNLI